LDRFQIGTHVFALPAAFALAVPIGWDREKRARSAGLRTFPLVTLASCGFVQAREGLLAQSPDGMSMPAPRPPARLGPALATPARPRTATKTSP
jgi:uncharacterized membrane protein YhiD involved in acid resistance